MVVTDRPGLDEIAQDVPSSVVEAAGRLLSLRYSPGRTAFVARVLHALVKLVDEMDERALGNAAGARSDYAVLVKALRQPEALEVLSADDPLAEARLRGLMAAQRLLTAEGGTVSASGVAEILQISRQAVDKRRRNNQLLALPIGSRRYAYPIWQFQQSGGTLPGWEAVLDDLRNHDPWMRLAFMLRSNPRLDGETPLAELRRGNLAGVRRAAQAFGEQGAA